MQVNKEIAKKVVQYVKEDAKRAYASSLISIYSFSKYCKDNNLFSDGDLVRNGEHFIHCPFHEDESPSLSFNESLGIWNCFSCGRGGSYIDFILHYENEILGNHISFYEKINQFLKNDVHLRNEIGASSVYYEDNLTDFQQVTKLKIKGFDEIPHSYLELSSLMLNKECPTNSIKYAVLLMQSNLTAEEIYKILKNEGDLK